MRQLVVLQDDGIWGLETVLPLSNLHANCIGRDGLMAVQLRPSLWLRSAVW